MRKSLLVLFMFASVIAFGGDSKCTKADQCTTQIFHQLDAISQISDLDKQIKNEFLDMSLELSKLQNDEVKAIMRPHIEKIRSLEKQRQELR